MGWRDEIDEEIKHIPVEEYMQDKLDELELEIESTMDINKKLHNIIRDLNKYIAEQQKDIAEKDKKIQLYERN